MIYYVCSYADYANLPERLFNGHTASDEKKSVDGTKFIAWSTELQATGSISWMNGTEPSFNHDDILIEVNKPEWIIEV